MNIVKQTFQEYSNSRSTQYTVTRLIDKDSNDYIRLELSRTKKEASFYGEFKKFAKGYTYNLVEVKSDNKEQSHFLTYKKQCMDKLELKRIEEEERIQKNIKAREEEETKEKLKREYISNFYKENQNTIVVKNTNFIIKDIYETKFENIIRNIDFTSYNGYIRDFLDFKDILDTSISVLYCLGLLNNTVLEQTMFSGYYEFDLFEFTKIDFEIFQSTNKTNEKIIVLSGESLFKIEYNKNKELSDLIGYSDFYYFKTIQITKIL